MAETTTATTTKRKNEIIKSRKKPKKEHQIEKNSEQKSSCKMSNLLKWHPAASYHRCIIIFLYILIQTCAHTDEQHMHAYIFLCSLKKKYL